MMKGAFNVIASLLVVVILLFALSGDCTSAVITPVKAQQSSAEEPGPAAENWEKDRKDIEIKNHIISAFRIVIQTFNTIM